MSDGRTAIRDRNGVAILDAAVAVLQSEPDAGMGAIAEAAGVGRATLYRHYPAREDLLTAIRTRVRARFKDLVTELVASGDEPAVALERFAEGLFSLREGYSAIAPASEARIRAVWAPVRRVFEDWGLDEWALAAFRGLLRAAAAEVDARRLARRDAPALVVRTFLAGVRTSSAATSR